MKNSLRFEQVVIKNNSKIVQMVSNSFSDMSDIENLDAEILNARSKAKFEILKKMQEDFMSEVAEFLKTGIKKETEEVSIEKKLEINALDCGYGLEAFEVGHKIARANRIKLISQLAVKKIEEQAA
ncbi:MAG: hypothetical protein H7252_02420 [Cytophaga sp.]|nr:hypothetical protein [Undibacterium sp.]